MDAIIEIIKDLIQTGIHFFNQPLIKDCIKDAVGSLTCLFALIEFYTIYHLIKRRCLSLSLDPQAPTWMQIFYKTSLVSAKISLILNALVSRPGIFIISTLIHRLFSTAQLETVFGPNTIFDINPWHPRHIISLVALALVFPILIQFFLQGIKWTYKKFFRYLSQQAVLFPQGNYINTQVKFIALFNFLTGRPVLHVGNQLAQLFLYYN